jgi:tRNA pseudouridine55 synthase
MIRRTLRWKAVGHAGTLDPSATGLLVVLCGDATRRSDEFMALPKEYRARIRFGFSTTSDDFEGEVTETRAVGSWDVVEIERALQSFTGAIEQVPPLVSAVKVGGQRSYRLARSGAPVAIEPRVVEIYEAKLLSHRQPEITVRIRCSRGTYVRSLARDLGQRLGWGGTLAALTRTAIGPYHLDRALSLQNISSRLSELSGD